MLLPKRLARSEQQRSSHNSRMGLACCQMGFFWPRKPQTPQQQKVPAGCLLRAALCLPLLCGPAQLDQEAAQQVLYLDNRVDFLKHVQQLLFLLHALVGLTGNAHLQACLGLAWGCTYTHTARILIMSVIFSCFNDSGIWASTPLNASEP